MAWRIKPINQSMPLKETYVIKILMKVPPKANTFYAVKRSN